jgi:hypothetical protein
MANQYAVRMALCIECSPAVQEVPGSLSQMLYTEDLGGPGQGPTFSSISKRSKQI